MSHTGPGMFQFGGQGPPLEGVAEQTLGAMRGHLVPGQRPVVPLTEQERGEAEEAARENERVCQYCIGLHPRPNSLGCPRIASGKLDGDGRLVEFTYWPGKEWAEGRITFVEDAFEDAAEEAGDGTDG